MHTAPSTHSNNVIYDNLDFSDLHAWSMVRATLKYVKVQGFLCFQQTKQAKQVKQVKQAEYTLRKVRKRRRYKDQIQQL